MDPLGARLRQASLGVPAPYHSLHKYLTGRFADSLVLTFGQIEDLIGVALPDEARHSAAWWLPPRDNGTPSEASGAWRLANRTATPNMAAQSVMFDRCSS